MINLVSQSILAVSVPVSVSVALLSGGVFVFMTLRFFSGAARGVLDPLDVLFVYFVVVFLPNCITVLYL